MSKSIGAFERYTDVHDGYAFESHREDGKMYKWVLVCLGDGSLYDHEGQISEVIKDLKEKLVKFESEVLPWKRTGPLRRKGRKKKWLPEEDILIMSEGVSLEGKMKLLERSEKSIKTRMWRVGTGKV